MASNWCIALAEMGEEELKNTDRAPGVRVRVGCGESLYDDAPKKHREPFGTPVDVAQSTGPFNPINKWIVSDGLGFHFQNAITGPWDDLKNR